jgi:hypothetical protein
MTYCDNVETHIVWSVKRFFVQIHMLEIEVFCDPDGDQQIQNSGAETSWKIFTVKAEKKCGHSQ